MSTTYPATKQSFTNPTAVNTLADPDHAGLHSDKNDTIEAIEDTIGTTAGTNVLKNFVAGQFPVRATGGAAVGTLIQTIVGGTLNSNLIGTATINSSTLGTATLISPVIDGSVSGSVIATGATINTGTATGELVTPKAIKDSTLYTPEAWIAPTLLNGWVNYNAEGTGVYDVAGYMKTADGFVHLRGFVKDGTINKSIFDLPEGYRPANYQPFTTSSNGSPSYLVVYFQGSVIPATGDNTWVSLGGLSFKP